MVNLVAYIGEDEVLVTTTALEAKMVKEWFDDGGRNKEVHYDRVETSALDTALRIRTSLKS